MMDNLTRFVVHLTNEVDLVTDHSSIDINERVWEGIRTLPELQYYIDSLREIHEDFAQIKKANAIQTAKGEKVDWSKVEEILNSLNDTNLESMLKCVNGVKDDLKEVSLALNLGASVQELKAKKTDFSSVQNSLWEISKLKSGLKEVEKVSNSMAKSRRARRAVNPKSLSQLENAQGVSLDLGRGVEVLREYSKILKNQKSVMVAVKAVDPLKSAIDSIQEARDVWTDRNRNDMEKMMSDLKALEVSCGVLNKDNMTTLWQVFKDAQQVSGVQIDAKVFADPIATVLSSNSDQVVQKASNDFKILGSLGLNFAQHQTFLKQAVYALPPLQLFFDEFFDISPAGKTPDQSLPDWLLATIVGSVGLGSVALLLVAAKYGLRYRKKRKVRKHDDKNYQNRDRHWIYEFFYKILYGASCLNELVRDNRVSEVKKLIQDGCYLNFYVKLDNNAFSATPLYHAVFYCCPNFVEILIQAGADRSLRSSDNLTAEQLMDRLLHDEEFKEQRPKLEDIAKIFKKYEMKTFRPKVRDLLPVDKFRIFLGTSTKNHKDFEKFKTTFEGMIQTKWQECSHIVLKTDANGVLDLDDEELSLRQTLVTFNCIMSPQILVKDTWMAACLENPKNFHLDYSHRITKVRLNGIVYNTVDMWKKWTGGWAVPPLHNVEIGNLYSPRFKPPTELETLMVGMGATFKDYDQVIQGSSRRTTKPYWFPNKNRHWLVYYEEVRPRIAYRFFVKSDLDELDSFREMRITNFYKVMLRTEGPTELRQNLANTNDETISSTVSSTKPESSQSNSSTLSKMTSTSNEKTRSASQSKSQKKYKDISLKTIREKRRPGDELETNVKEVEDDTLEQIDSIREDNSVKKK